MARPVEFDHDTVLNNAMLQFWKEGFEASSVQKLLDASDINRGTLYNSFGDKDTFFKACLDMYNDNLKAVIDTTLADKSLKPAVAIRAFFDASLLSVPAQQRTLGCLLVNSACESIVWDAEIQKLLKSSMGTIRKAFLARTRELEKSSKLKKNLTAELAADMLMNTLSGLRVGARQGQTPKQMTALVEFTLGSISK